MGKITPPAGGACWEGFRWDDCTIHCDEVYGHAGNHIGTEDRLVWTPDGVVVGGSLASAPPLGPFVYGYDEDEDIDPDELGTFGEVLDHYTRRGGPTADERTAFWMSWTKSTIVWAFVLIGALVVSETFDEVVSDIGLLVTIYAGLVLIWQAVEAVRFGREGRRWQR